MTDHDDVRDLLATWAFGALEPAEERLVPPHLAACESCAEEAERLRATVRLLDGPPLDEPPPALDTLLAGALRARPASSGSSASRPATAAA